MSTEWFAMSGFYTTRNIDTSCWGGYDPSLNTIPLEQGNGTLGKGESHYPSHLPKSCLSER